MTFKIRIRPFELRMQSLGAVYCRHLTATIFSEIDKQLADNNLSSNEFVRWLAKKLIRKSCEGNGEDAADGVAFPDETFAGLSDSDLEEFADEVVKKCGYLQKTRCGKDIQRKSSESAVDFLVRAFRHHAAEQKAQWERMTKPLSASYFSQDTLEAMKRNLLASDQFQNSIDRYLGSQSLAEKMFAKEKNRLEALTKPSAVDGVMRNIAQSGHGRSFEDNAVQIPGNANTRNEPAPEYFHHPPNPIHETNEKLGAVASVIEEMRPMAAHAAQVIQGLNEVAQKMQIDYIKNSEATERQTRNAFWVAAISLFVSAIGLVASSWFSYQSYLDGKAAEERAKTQLAAFTDEISKLAKSQREGQAELIKGISEFMLVPTKKNRK
jgi:hypothetical protein